MQRPQMCKRPDFGSFWLGISACLRTETLHLRFAAVRGDIALLIFACCFYMNRRDFHTTLPLYSRALPLYWASAPSAWIYGSVSKIAVHLQTGVRWGSETSKWSTGYSHTKFEVNISSQCDFRAKKRLLKSGGDFFVPPCTYTKVVYTVCV